MTTPATTNTKTPLPRRSMHSDDAVGVIAPQQRSPALPETEVICREGLEEGVLREEVAEGGWTEEVVEEVVGCVGEEGVGGCY